MKNRQTTLRSLVLLALYSGGILLVSTAAVVAGAPGSSTPAADVDPPAAGHAPDVGGRLIFASGFEPDTAVVNGRLLANVDRTGPEGKSDWSALSSGETLPWVAGANGFFEGGAMDLTNDPKNPANTVLHFHNQSSPPPKPRSRTQWTLKQIKTGWTDDGQPNRFSQQFYSYKLLIPRAIRDMVPFSRQAEWYMIWESHTWPLEDTRHGVYLKKDKDSDHWYFDVVQEQPEGRAHTTWENTPQYGANGQEHEVPFGEWFTVDVFFKYHETDGRFFVAITPGDGRRRIVGDFVGKTKYGTKLHDQMVFKMYHHENYTIKSNGEGTHQYYDDFEIWSDFPPEYFSEPPIPASNAR